MRRDPVRSLNAGVSAVGALRGPQRFFADSWRVGKENGRHPVGVPAVRPDGSARQPCLTSISVLLKMLFPLEGSVGVPLSITPVRFFQIVLPAIANGPSLST
jgi:hypothetical protein